MIHLRGFFFTIPSQALFGKSQITAAVIDWDMENRRDIMRIVMKFGGSSLATAVQMRAAAGLVAAERNQGNQVAVVVSAQGDTTDELEARAEEVCARPNPREKDQLLACGEQMSMALMAMALEALDCPALSLTGWQAGIRTEPRHGEARILRVEPDRIRQAWEQGKVAVVAGFQGIDSRGEVTTIGRGGSDTTAVALAAALGADACRIYTDVKGVYSADPRVVEAAQVHREISYDEMLTMADLGAQVLHSRAVELAREHQVRVEVRSTFAPQDSGTALCTGEPKNPVRGITCDDAVTMVAVTCPGRETCRLFARLSESGVPIDVIIRSPGSGQGRVRFSVSAADGSRVADLLAQWDDLHIGQSETREGMAKVSVIGAGGGCALAARMLEALQQGGIEPSYITTGDLRTSVILPKEQAEQAVRLLHAVFFGR